MCSFHHLTWNSPQKVVPTIHCDPHNASLIGLRLARRKYDDNTDYLNLTSLVNIPSFVDLALDLNDFTTFPDFPLVLRQKLRILELRKNDINTIPDAVLDGYALDSLSLTRNDLTAIPLRLFSLTSELLLSQMSSSFQDWTPYVWNSVFCYELYYGLTYISLEDTITNVMKFPEISTSSCHRPENITINLQAVSTSLLPGVFKFSILFCLV
jgi:Leucine-rich repeat (LRR) protein